MVAGMINKSLIVSLFLHAMAFGTLIHQSQNEVEQRQRVEIELIETAPAKTQPAAKKKTSRITATLPDDSGSQLRVGSNSQSTRIYATGEVEEMARPLYVPRPKYPVEALRRGVESSVKVKMLVDEYGKVSMAQALEQAGFGLESAAEKAAMDMLFDPARIKKLPVKVNLIWTFHFRIRDT